jgi:YVTN family beta-propeller protein
LAVLIFAAIVAASFLPERISILEVGAEQGLSTTATGFPYSTPITLNAAGTQLWVVNPDPDNNSVTVIDVSGDEGRVIREIAVGQEPNSVALNADASRAYVANTVSGTVSVIDTRDFSLLKNIKAGTEPRALCFSPNFTKLYVACSSSNNVHVINPDENKVVKVIENPSFSNLFAMTITNDEDGDDNDELLYVTNLLADYVPGSAPKPADDLGKQGVVNVISVGTDEFIDRVALNPVKTAFKSNGRSRNASGDAIAPDPNNPTNFFVETFAFPNKITSITGTRVGGTNRIYTFATGTSPTGPLRFNVEVQSLVTLIQGLDDAGQTANLNDEIRLETTHPFPDGTPRHRFATMPWGLAFFHNSNRALGVASASDYIVMIDFDANGKAVIDQDPDPAAGKTDIARILTGIRRDPDSNHSIFFDGKSPRGVVINQGDTRAYTFNYVSRDVTIIDLVSERPLATVATTESKGHPVVQYGKELFNTSIGPIDPSNKNADGTVNPIEGCMADFGWVGCISCHINGLTDGVAWSFETGPRVSTPLNTTFIKQGQGQRPLNWSAVRDEVEDFEKNTRDIAGGVGLILLANGNSDPDVVNLGRPSSGRDPRRDAITEYVKTIRSPIAPLDANDPEVQAGRNLFKKVGCAQCHGSRLWTKSRVQFPPPPPAGDLLVEGGTAQLKGQLVDVGTFNPANPHEVRGAPATLNNKALGAAGFNIPSLLGVHQRERFLLHDGLLTSFEQLFDNPAHVGEHPKLRRARVRRKIIKFLRSIDDRTEPLE